MASGPDLFVVCKSCGSEVSPYITECPYCGTRLRKRADRKSTRLNSSHANISYAVFCLKKKNELVDGMNGDSRVVVTLLGDPVTAQRDTGPGRLHTRLHATLLDWIAVSAHGQCALTYPH